MLFVGRTAGQIVAPKVGGGWGWDAIFVPDGHEKPFSGMDLDEKNVISHRSRALSQFVDYLQRHEDDVMEAIMNGGETDLQPGSAPPL